MAYQPSLPFWWRGFVFDRKGYRLLAIGYRNHEGREEREALFFSHELHELHELHEECSDSHKPIASSIF